MFSANIVLATRSIFLKSNDSPLFCAPINLAIICFIFGSVGEATKFLLTKYFVEDNDITDIDFKNQLLKAYLLTKGKDSDTDSNNKYFKYLDRLFSKLSQKGNKKNRVNIDPYEVGDIEMEHFLARLYNSTERSLVRLFGVNFFALDKSTSPLDSLNAS